MYSYLARISYHDGTYRKAVIHAYHASQALRLAAANDDTGKSIRSIRLLDWPDDYDYLNNPIDAHVYPEPDDEG
jgi:hypothetical protein